MTAPPTSAFEYVLPLPPRLLSPNSGGGRSRGWRAVASARRDYRELCAGLLRAAARPPAPFPRATVSCTMLICRRRVSDHSPLQARDCYRPRDVFNAVSALKPLYDALADAGVIEDDDQAHCEMGRHVIEEVPAFEAEGVRVLVKVLRARGRS